MDKSQERNSSRSKFLVYFFLQHHRTYTNDPPPCPPSPSFYPPCQPPFPPTVSTFHYFSIILHQLVYLVTIKVNTISVGLKGYCLYSFLCYFKSEIIIFSFRLLFKYSLRKKDGTTDRFRARARVA